MSLAMTKQERERFLADLHMGIIRISEEGRGPLTVPIWYSYTPGGEVRAVTSATSRKAQLLRKAHRLQPMCTDRNAAIQVCERRGPNRFDRAGRAALSQALPDWAAISRA